MYHNKNIKEIIEELNTNENGLTKDEAEKRKKQNGKNEITKPPEKTVFNIFFQQFKSPIVYILLIAAIFSLIVKSYSDAIFIFLVTIINSIIGTYQEWSSQKNAEKLQNMIKIKVKVLRNGKREEINSEDIVMGDIVFLESGDKVPADIRLMETNNLSIDESILTGESISRNKDENVIDENVDIADRSNIAYAGTIVTKGRGKGIVIAIGNNTEFGKIADKVLMSEDTKTPLVIKIEKFTKQISIGFLFLAVILSFILFLKGYGIQEIFQNVIALTVSSIPEGLTIAMTIVLSITSTKMAEKNVIVKKLSAVESLGSCTVIATDKTGTLTANEQTAKKIVLSTKTQAYIKGVGYNDIGEIEHDEISESESNTLKEIVKLGMLNNEATLKFENEKWIYQGDAIDIAFLALGYKMQIKPQEKIVDIIPYESKQKYSAVFFKNIDYVQTNADLQEKDTKENIQLKQNKEITKNLELNESENVFCTVKGATEKILEFCKYMQANDKVQKVDKEKIIFQAEDLAKQGYRVIAIAKGNVNKEEFQDEEKRKDLIFLGLIAFVDPIREDVIDAVRICNTAGIKVVMITGDHPLTANAIGERIGIKEIHARISPMEKLEIVENLKESGEFVAVTGDGVNDSPALKAANIGIAMGSGTDIAKETGNMIIVDDNFASIVKGVELGRKAYNNIRKVIYLLLSTGFSEVILYVLSILFGLPIPLTPIQLLWLNLISNGIQGDALAFEKDIEDVMKKKVKNTKESIVNKLLISEIAISSITMATIEFLFYLYLINQNIDIGVIRAYLLTLKVLMENVQIFNCRSETISCFKISGLNNKFLIASIIITSLIQFTIIQIPAIANFFGFEVISINSAGYLIFLTLPVILMMEVFKKIHQMLR